jgi:hypothetical protein
MKKLVNHIKIMIKYVKHNVSIKKFGESQIMDMLEKDIMVVLMKKI